MHGLGLVTKLCLATRMLGPCLDVKHQEERLLLGVYISLMGWNLIVAPSTSWSLLFFIACLGQLHRSFLLPFKMGFASWCVWFQLAHLACSCEALSTFHAYPWSLLIQMKGLVGPLRSHSSKLDLLMMLTLKSQQHAFYRNVHRKKL